MRPTISVLAVFFVLACTRESPPRRPRFPFAEPPYVSGTATRVSLEVDEWSCWGGSSRRIDAVVMGERVRVWTEEEEGRDGATWTRQEWDVTRGRINGALLQTWRSDVPGVRLACKAGANWNVAFVLSIDGVVTCGCSDGALYELLRGM